MAMQAATLPDFTTYYDASLMNPKVLVGVFLGAMATFVFCAMTMKAVGRAAKGMVEEVRRQFKEKPGIMEGTEKPDYARPVAISTKAAQREMILPSLLGLITPILVGLLLGVGGVMGLLVGTLTTGFCVAIFMANAGGSWDNAKKYIEAGQPGRQRLRSPQGRRRRRHRRRSVQRHQWPELEHPDQADEYGQRGRRGLGRPLQPDGHGHLLIEVLTIKTEAPGTQIPGAFPFLALGS